MQKCRASLWPRSERRRSSSGSGLMKVQAEGSVAATAIATEAASKDIVPMKRLSGIKAGRRSFTGNFDGVMQEVIKQNEESIAEETRRQTVRARPLQRLPRREKIRPACLSAHESSQGGWTAHLYKYRQNRGVVCEGRGHGRQEEGQKVNFAEVIGNKADGKSDGRAVRRDYSKAAGVIRRASTAGGASIPQRHLPKFKPATVITAEEGEGEEGTSTDSPEGGRPKSQYVSPAEREKREEEAKNLKEAAMKREMGRAAEINRKALEEKEARARKLAKEQQERDDDEAESAMAQDETPIPVSCERVVSATTPVETFDNDSEGDDEDEDEDEDEDGDMDTQPTSYVRRLSTSISEALTSATTTSSEPEPQAKAVAVASDSSWGLFGSGKTTSVIGKDVEKDNLYYTTYFCKEAPQREDGPLVEEGQSCWCPCGRTSALSPFVGFSRQNLFLVRDPPALSDVTGHLRFPSVSLEYAEPPMATSGPTQKTDRTGASPTTAWTFSRWRGSSRQTRRGRRRWQRVWRPAWRVPARSSGTLQAKTTS